MKVLVIGSGVIGLATAHFLTRQGCQVTVIDREAGPGRQTSFANGALLHPSMPEPWNSPGSWRLLLGSLLRSDSPLQLRVRALPQLSGWGIRFLRSSKPAAFELNTRSNLRLALYSLGVMHELRQQTHIEYGRTVRGTLKVFRDGRQLDEVTAAARRLAAEGLTSLPLSPGQAADLEPALLPIVDQLAGAIHYPADEGGDAHRFCLALTEYLKSQGVEFRFKTDVSSLQLRAGRVTAVLGGEPFLADNYVVAAGSYSMPLLRSVGIDLAVRPAKGYSVTFEVPVKSNTLRIPVIDNHLHAAVVPLDGVIRVVGTAEFAGFDHSLAPDRIRNLLRLLRRILPEMHFDPALAKPWCGLRPMSADGVPIIGRTNIENLFVNTGHGHLGWTLAAGSGALLADQLCGGDCALDGAPYALARFGG